MSHLRSTCRAVALGLVVGAAMASPASAASDHRTVKVLDDCEVTSFNAAIGPGTCVGDGRTLFGDFLAEFQATRAVDGTGEVDGWEFKPDEFKIGSRDVPDCP